MLKNRLRRYSGLVGLIAALVVFVIGVLIANSFIDSQVVQRDSFSASRTANYLQLLERIGPGDEVLKGDILAHVHRIRDGGSLVRSDGRSWETSASSDAQVLAAIEKITSAANANDVAGFDQAYQDFAQNSAADESASLDLLNIVHFIASAIIFIGLLGVLGILFFRLGRADDLLEQNAAETAHIMAAVDNGLFLIDQDFQIGQQKSNAVQDIFGETVDFEGDFLDVMSDYISAQNLKLTREYVKLLLDGRVKQKLMSDLNPLNKIAVEVEQVSGAIDQKFLNFEFTKGAIQEGSDDGTQTILVTVTDVTKEVQLEHELAATKEQQKERMTLLMSVLHVQPDDLVAFLDQSDAAWNEINDTLSGENLEHEDNLQKLNNVFTSVHKLKGHAGALGLSLFEASINRFEDSITDLQKQPFIDWRKMLGLTVQLKDMIAEGELVRGLTPKFRELAALNALPEPKAESEQPVAPSVTARASNVPDRLTTLANRVAQREGKKVDLDCKGFELLKSSPVQQEGAYAIAVQLVRNSIVHGIEQPSERLELGKKPIGLVSVMLDESDDDDFSLSVRDDGRGIQFDQIKGKAIDEKLLDKKEAEGLKRNQLLKFLFQPGFSLASKPGMDAGRGVGLDAVKKQIKQLSGKVSIRTIDNKFSQFVITFPKGSS